MSAHVRQNIVDLLTSVYKINEGTSVGKNSLVRYLPSQCFIGLI